jgi:hypothetical protein
MSIEQTTDEVVFYISHAGVRLGECRDCTLEDAIRQAREATGPDCEAVDVDDGLELLATVHDSGVVELTALGETSLSDGPNG